MTRWIPVLFLLALILSAASAEAQSSTDLLTRAERLVQEGRFAQAREAVEQWWNEGQDGAAREQRQTGIWLRALLTVDPDMADLDYRRLVVEFPGGPYSDEALLRLSRGAEARGDLPAARRYLNILVRDYPGSPHRPEARSLLARIAEGAPAAGEGAAPLPPDVRGDRDEPPRPRDTPEPRERDARPDTPVDDTGGPGARALEGGEEGDLPPPAEAPFAVQLGAFSTLDRALDLAGVARAEGLEVRIVQVDGHGLFRVRLGGFRDRDGAREEVDRIRTLGLDATISTDRDRERPAG